MVYCSVNGCQSSSASHKRKPGITFHKFPKDSKRRTQWINALNRKNWLPSSGSVLCSQHFKEEDIDRTSLSCVRLREGAIPKIFPSPTADVQSKKKVHRSRKRVASPLMKTNSAASKLHDFETHSEPPLGEFVEVKTPVEFLTLPMETSSEMVLCDEIRHKITETLAETELQQKIKEEPLTYYDPISMGLSTEITFSQEIKEDPTDYYLHQRHGSKIKQETSEGAFYRSIEAPSQPLFLSVDTPADNPLYHKFNKNIKEEPPEDSYQSLETPGSLLHQLSLEANKVSPQLHLQSFSKSPSMETPMEVLLRHKLDKKMRRIGFQTKKIKVLQQKVRRLTKQVANYKLKLRRLKNTKNKKSLPKVICLVRNHIPQILFPQSLFPVK